LPGDAVDGDRGWIDDVVEHGVVAGVDDYLIAGMGARNGHRDAAGDGGAAIRAAPSRTGEALRGRPGRWAERRGAECAGDDRKQE
jgi:hypothetical protein